MAEPILTKFGMKHPLVNGIQICSYKGAWSQGGPQGATTTKGGCVKLKKNLLLVNYK